MAKRKETEEEIIKEANERFRRAHEHQADAHRHFVADMQFANGDDENGWQWQDSISAGRRDAKRPALTVNKTRVHCLQIINDARQNPVQVRVNPVSDDASYEAAQIFEGIIRHIEYISNAQQAYANATYNQVMGGIGYWRVLVDYAHEDTFDQEIFIRRIPDPTSVYMDPDMQQADGSDAKWAFVFYDCTRDEYEQEYGDSDDPDDANLNNQALSSGVDRAKRVDDKHVELVEYYRVGEKNDKLLQLPVTALQFLAADLAAVLAPGADPQDGFIVRESLLRDGDLKELKRLGIMPIAERDIAEPQVEYFKIADDKIIERKDWLGRYIPIVRVPCEEIIIEGKLDWISHVRHLRDPQRLYNWYSSQAAEFVALQTKAPYIAVAEAVEDHINDWERANIENKSVLLYKGKDERDQPIPPPERAQPPVMAPAYIEGLKIAQAEMMMATGQYQAVLGEPSNEVSGKAINARQRQGDNANYHIIDRLAAAIRFTGRIIIDLVPKVYETARILLIMGEDGSRTQVHLDPNAQQSAMTTPDPNAPPPQPSMKGEVDPDVARAQAMRTIFNPNIGRYSVVADVGPAYATKRQEAFNAFSQILAQNGAAFQIVGDYWAKNADFPGADELAARLKQGLPPQYQQGAPNPQVMQLQAQLQHTTQQAQQLLQKADAEIQQLKAEKQNKQGELSIKAHQAQVDDYEAETRRLAAVGQIDPASLQIIVRQMVQDMLGTDIVERLHAHAGLEGALQTKMQPQPLPAPQQPEQPDPNAVPPGIQMAHHMADLAQKHADIQQTQAETHMTLNPPAPEPAQPAAE